MNTYHEMYLQLVSATSQVIYDLQAAADSLIRAQWAAEETLRRRDKKTAQQKFEAADADLRAAIKELLPQEDPEGQRS